jgi:hypothetical protein
MATQNDPPTKIAELPLTASRFHLLRRADVACGARREIEVSAGMLYRDRYRRHDLFDPIELNGDDLRRHPLAGANPEGTRNFQVL